MMRAYAAKTSVRRRRVNGFLPLSFLVFTLVAILDTPRVSGQQPETPGSPAQLLGLNDIPLKQYRAYRRMHAINEKFGHEAWLEAWTELDERGFRYEIVSERGSETIRNKVLKAVLAREQQLIKEGPEGRAELSTDNYTFEEGPDGNGVRYVLLKPKRKDVLLVDGRMVLNEDGTQLLRVEGRLSKNPSFWTSLVNVIRDFARLDGVRVPVTTETIAKVKLAGLARMMVRYEYQSINGRAVSMSARRTMASAGATRY